MLLRYFEGLGKKPQFRGRNLWSLENAFTESFKELLPLRQYEITAKLGKFVQKTMDDNKRLAEEEETCFAELFEASLRDETESKILSLPAWTGEELR